MILDDLFSTKMEFVELLKPWLFVFIRKLSELSRWLEKLLSEVLVKTGMEEGAWELLS